jgi:hypothetical protein
VSLTETGAALREKARGVPRKVAGATGMGLAELDALRQDLVRLTESVAAHRLTPDE